MTMVGIVLAAGAGERFEGQQHKLRADLCGRPVLAWSLEAALQAPVDEVLLAVSTDPFDDIVIAAADRVFKATGALPPPVRLVSVPDAGEGQSRSIQAALTAARKMGHTAAIIGLGDQPLTGPTAWKAVATSPSPIAIASFAGDVRPPMRIEAGQWQRLPETGDFGGRRLLAEAPDLVVVVPTAGDPRDIDTLDDLASARQAVQDTVRVTELIGRKPMGRFEVAVRDGEGIPIVLENHPLLFDGTPMPTLYWLCGPRESLLIGRLESAGGVDRAEAEIGLEIIAEAHDRYRAQRDERLAGLDAKHVPTGGVGGTRVGVKCLHAHYAWWLAGGQDPVGQWVADHLHEVEDRS